MSGTDLAIFSKSDTAAASFSLVKDHVAVFVEHSTLVISVLDEVAKIHPFISGKHKQINISQVLTSCSRSHRVQGCYPAGNRSA
jgi:hypothetical protein